MGFITASRNHIVIPCTNEYLQVWAGKTSRDLAKSFRKQTFKVFNIHCFNFHNNHLQREENSGYCRKLKFYVPLLKMETEFIFRKPKHYRLEMCDSLQDILVNKFSPTVKFRCPYYVQFYSCMYCYWYFRTCLHSKCWICTSLARTYYQSSKDRYRKSTREVCLVGKVGT